MNTKESLKLKTLQALPWTVIARVGRFLMAILTSIIVVRLLGKEQYGIYSIVHSILLILMYFIMFGFNQVLLKYLPDTRVKYGEQFSRRFMQYALLTELILWLITILGVILAKPIIVKLYGTDIFKYLLFGIVVISASVLFETISIGIITRFATRLMAQWHIIGGGIVTVLTYIFLRKSWGIYGVLGAVALSNAIISFVLGMKYFSDGKNRLSTSTNVIPETAPPPTAKNLIIDAIPYLLTSILAYISWKQSEVLFIGYFVGKTEAGFFDIGYSFADLIVNFIPLAIFPLMFAAYAEAYAKNPAHITESMFLHFKLLFLITAPLVAGGVIFGDRAITIIYSAEMAPGGPICQIFFFVFSLSFWGAPFSLAIYAIGKPWWNFLFYSITSFIILGCDYYFIKHYGFYGAIVGTTVAIAISPFLRYLILRRFVKKVLVPWQFCLKCLLAGTMAFPLIWFRPYISDFPRLVISGVLVLIIYLVCLKFFRVITDDIIDYLAKSNLPLRDWLIKFFR